MEDFEQMLVCPHCGSVLEYISEVERIGGIDECDTVVTVKHFYKEV